MSANAMNVDKVSSRRRYDSNGGRTVMAEPANNKTYMDSFVNLVKGISQAYTNPTTVDEKDPIVWASYFSYTDAFGYEGIDAPNTLLLVLGYSNGMQMWMLKGNSEAQEMFSLRDGPVKTACLLPPPPPSSEADLLQDKRPLMAICLTTDSKQIFASVSIQSLRTGEQVKKLQFASDVVSLHAGPANILLVALKDSIHCFDLTSLNLIFVVNDCYPGSASALNPVALGKRWLFYSPNMPITSLQSSGGAIGDSGQSYVTSLLNTAKTISKGISSVSDTVNWLAAKSRLTTSLDETSSATSALSRDRWGSKRSMTGSASSERNGENHSVPGLVTVLDVEKIIQSIRSDDSGRKVAVDIDCEPTKRFVVAHFPAHVGQTIVRIQLSPSGSLLATADCLGHAFHVFAILPHPASSTLGAVHHLYTLRRGNTPAQVQELRFSWDSRWLIASTLRGTCHIFPVSPYGGTPCVRTHTSDRVVNRSSTFHKSAGLDEMELFEPQPQPAYRPLSDNPPPPLSQGVLGWQTQYRVLAPRSLASSNPRLPPYPHPVTLHAVDHIRLCQSTSASIPGVLPSQTAFSPTPSDSTAVPLTRPTDVVIATRFLYSPRNDKAVTNGATSTVSGGSQRLLIVSSSGYLTEYLLEPRARPGLPKISDESPVEAQVTERVRWQLQRQTTWNTVSLALSPRSPLITADNVCRRHYDITRMRIRESQKTFLATDVAAKLSQLDSEETRTRDTALPRKSKHSMTKASNNVIKSEVPIAPVSAKIIRNGNGTSKEEEVRLQAPKESSQVIKASPMVSDEWLSQVEMVTHEGPARRLWMGPQFHFKHFLSTGSTCVLSSDSSALLSSQRHLVDPYISNCSFLGGVQGDDLYEEELDVCSLRIHSEPVPTPTSRRKYCLDDNDVSVDCCSSITIEAGSGNFDRATQMLDTSPLGSLQDRRYSGNSIKAREEKLKERIAEAMVELNGDTTKISATAPVVSSSPSYKMFNKTKFDNTDCTSLDLQSEHFDFSSMDNPATRLSGDK